MNQHYLQLYADFIVKVGVNVQPRQNFIIRCPVTMPEFGHACVKAGYEAGAKNCIVRWEDDKLSRLHYEYAKEEDLAAMKPYELRSYLDYAEDPDGCCTLAIHAADPEALPTVEDTISILRGLKERYEVFHGVKINDSALIAAATLSDRY